MRTVVTNGCFDILHAGHIHLLHTAKLYGDRLIVGLNSDRAVRELKGENRPLQKQEHRKYALEAIRYVDGVVIVDSIDMVNFLSAMTPDVWVKGGDYTLESLNQNEVAIARRLACEIVLVPELFKIHTNEFLR